MTNSQETTKNTIDDTTAATISKNTNSIANVPSLLKWTGSKRSQVSRISAYVPEHRRYFEPFLGGGAMLFIYAHPGAIAGDIYAPLIDFWKMVRDNPKYLISNYSKQWKALQRDLPEYFYTVRDRFNKTHQPEDLNFLMRTCVNGIARFSKKGDFNNSFHLSRKGMKPDRFSRNVSEWSNRIQGVEFRNGDYLGTIIDAKVGDFLYLDPPYGGNKQRYINDIDIDSFFDHLEDLNIRRVKWALSFDGSRGNKFYRHMLPKELYRRKTGILNGYSSVIKVLNGPVEMVSETLYLNY